MPIMKNLDKTRRRFMAHFAGIGLGATLVPGVLWARMQDAGAQQITLPMITDALNLAGLEFSEEDRQAMVQAANRSLTSYKQLHTLHVPNDISPPFHFSPIVPGIEVNRTKVPMRISNVTVKRPANLEEVAFWPVRDLAELIKTKQVTSTELTRMYLDRLHKFGGPDKLNCVVTYLDDLALQQAKQADAEIASGRYKGPLHGIPWGVKDIISVKGYRTTWGSGAFKDQVFDYDATVVNLLRDAGAVLLAKLASGEMAQGDNWWGGQTKSPWDMTRGSSGSSAGPGSATGGGLVGFSIGTETSGSILSPSAVCGVTGLRPTFGRISRYGAMALSWTQDRLGPMCRYAEDCALVLQAAARQDNKDFSVSDVPFNWNAQLDIKKLRVGYIKDSFETITDETAKTAAQSVLDTLTKLGVSKFIPLEIPEWPYDGSAITVESATFFDEFVRSGGMDRMTNPRSWSSFKSGRLVPAVEYLQSQRARMMMMMKLAEATAGVDVYLVASANGGGGFRGGGRGAAAGAPGAAAGAPPAGAPGAGRGAGGPGGRGGGGGFPGANSAAGRHSTMANLACYPAVNVVPGFNATGYPLSMTFFARPYGEAELLALAKAYQDSARHHLKHPALA
jgi:Asp-tRNA(Asn)/Glu-tRNA(Gln) amidotransferase A subunit family amidase